MVYHPMGLLMTSFFTGYFVKKDGLPSCGIAAVPPVAVGKRGALSQLGSGSLSLQVKPGGSAD